jgi:hypothetical protein
MIRSSIPHTVMKIAAFVIALGAAALPLIAQETVKVRHGSRGRAHRHPAQTDDHFDCRAADRSGFNT